MKIVKLSALLLVLISSVSLISACNTVQGAGQDISNAGKSISKAAKQAK